MPTLALVLLAVFGLLALGLRMLVQLRRTGSTGFRGVGGAPGSVEWFGGLLVVLAIALCAAGPVLQLVAGLDPMATLDGDIGHVIGVVLATGGIIVTVAAQFAMGDAWRIGVDPAERTQLVTNGVFSIVRNPIYAAMVPSVAGIALLAPSIFTVAGAGLVVVSAELQTRLVEEPHLLRVHGEEYVAYAARVGRFIPGVGRLRHDVSRHTRAQEQ